MMERRRPAEKLLRIGFSVGIACAAAVACSDSDDGAGSGSDSDTCAGGASTPDIAEVVGGDVTLEVLDRDGAVGLLTEGDYRAEELLADDGAEITVCQFEPADGSDITLIVVQPGTTGWPDESVDSYLASYDSQAVEVAGEPGVYFSDEIPPSRADLWVDMGDELDLVVVGDDLDPEQSLEIAEAFVTAVG